MANANVAKKEETLPALNLSVMEQDASSGLENIHQETEEDDLNEYFQGEEY